MTSLRFATRYGTLLVTLLWLSACAWMQPDSSADKDKPEVRTTGAIGVNLDDDRQTFGVGREGDPDETPAEPDLFPGSDKLYRMPGVHPAILLEGERVVLNFQKTPLEDVVHGVLGDILGLDYIIEKPIPGEVTLRSQAPLPRDQLLGIVESMLQAHNLVMLRDENNRFIISNREGMTNYRLNYANPRTQGAGFSHIIVPLEHIGANEMVEILRPVATDRAFVRVDTIRNLLILAGTQTQLRGWLEIVETFDVDLLSGMSVGVFPIEYNSVSEITTALEPLLGGVTGQGEGTLTGLVRLIPLENMGSILVVTPKQEYLKKVQEWIRRLDKAPEQGAEPQLFVYSVQNSTASYLADLLSSVFGGTTSSTSGRTGSQANRGVSPGLTPSNLSSDNNTSSRNDSGTRRSGANNRQGASSFDLGDSVRVVADEVNNTLLIHATGNEYKKIQRALEKLDIMPLQVLIEATILEVTLEDSLRYGLEWYMDNSLGGGWRGEGQLDLGDTGLGLTVPGFGYAFNNPMGELRAVLNTLANKNLVNVVSTPSIMVLDNHSANIHVGNQQPIQTSSVIIEGGGGVSRSISYRDTGVKLDVTPSVNAGGLVTMELKQSVTDVGAEVDESTGQVPFFERNIASRVAVRSGESVVLGGLISDNRRRGKTGLPFFQDLPIIGNLFGSTNISESRTELLVIITPHVVKSDNDLRELTREMRSRMKGLQIFDDKLPNSLESFNELSDL